MTPAQQWAAKSTNAMSNRTRSHQLRHPDDPLSDSDIDRIVLQAIDAGGDYAGIQRALAAARAAALARGDDERRESA